jgi:predicted CopG family antitoxin
MVKPVSLSNEAYEVLSRMKTKGESFSDVILRLVEKDKKKFRIEDFAGKWKGKDFDDLGNIFKDIERNRKKFKTTKVKF